MPATYEAISSTTIGSQTATFTFSSIPSTYTDLVLIQSGLSNITADVLMRFNNNTSSVYKYTFLYGNVSAAVGTFNSSGTAMYLDYYAEIDSAQLSTRIVNIMNYANTTTFKTVLGRAINADRGTEIYVGEFESTAAITSITLFPANSREFSTGNIFTLYGIKAA